MTGTNELVFGVVGDLSPFDPTGVEFDATVSFVRLGDVDGDGMVNLLDVEPFVNVISSGEFQLEADCNQDGVVNLLDVDAFIGILSGN